LGITAEVYSDATAALFEAEYSSGERALVTARQDYAGI